MTDRIIQKDGNQLCELRRIACKQDTFLNIGLQRFSLIKSKALKGKRFAGHNAGEVHLFHGDFRIFSPGKIQQLFYKTAHTLIFILDIGKPLITADLT